MTEKASQASWAFYHNSGIWGGMTFEVVPTEAPKVPR